LPDHARVHYNLGLLLRYLNRPHEAEAALLKALALEPGNMDYLYALADYYIKEVKFQEAKAIAEQMIAKHPSKKIGRDLLDFINRRLK